MAELEDLRMTLAAAVEELPEDFAPELPDDERLCSYLKGSQSFASASLRLLAQLKYLIEELNVALDHLQDGPARLIELRTGLRFALDVLTDPISAMQSDVLGTVIRGAQQGQQSVN